VKCAEFYVSVPRVAQVKFDAVPRTGPLVAFGRRAQGAPHGRVRYTVCAIAPMGQVGQASRFRLFASDGLKTTAWKFQFDYTSGEIRLPPPQSAAGFRRRISPNRRPHGVGPRLALSTFSGHSRGTFVSSKRRSAKLTVGYRLTILDGTSCDSVAPVMSRWPPQMT
jgi:hypothetical protein